MPPPRGRRRKGQTSGLNLWVVDLPLYVLRGDLCHRVKEDQLPLPPLPPGPVLSRRLGLDMKEEFSRNDLELLRVGSESRLEAGGWPVQPLQPASTLRLLNQRVKSGTFGAGDLRLLGGRGGEGGIGTETGVRCSAGGGGRLMSSCGISPASSLDGAVGCNLTWGAGGSEGVCV